MRPKSLTALALAAALLGSVPARAGEGPAPRVVPFSEFLALVRSGDLASVKAMPGHTTAEATTRSGEAIETTPAYYQNWIEEAARLGTKVEVDMAPAVDPAPRWLFWVETGMRLVTGAFLILLFGGLILTVMGRLQLTQVGQRFRRGRKSVAVTFADVAGAQEAKVELQEVVAYLRDPARFERLGGRAPRGILLVGPPGNGKTLVAKAVAGEAGVPFRFCTGSDFVEMFVGLGARRVRSTFKNARSRTPSILFIDEIDALGRKRNGSSTDASREHDQTLNALLVELDGMATKHGLVVIAATNLAEALDPALIRPGRFDRHIDVGLPDLAARADILRIHARKVTLAPDVDLGTVARGTPGFSGADLEALVNAAALEAARTGAAAVAREHFESARDRKLLGGGERRGTALSAEEKRIIAFHEGGHALAGVLQDQCDPVHKATIIPRGRSLGAVSSLPEREQVLVRRSKMMAELTMAMAGRAAEEIAFGPEEITGGAAADIQHVTERARAMVARYGLGRTVSDRSDRSGLLAPETVREVDVEVDRIVADALDRARALLTENRTALDALADALVERETLDGDEIRELVAAHRPALRLAS